MYHSTAHTHTGTDKKRMSALVTNTGNEHMYIEIFIPKKPSSTDSCTFIHKHSTESKQPITFLIGTSALSVRDNVDVMNYTVCIAIPLILIYALQ
jgi:hypothetical protein